MSSELPSSALYRRAGWLCWLSLAVAITITVEMSILTGQERSVTPAYRSAVMNWFSSQPLYNMRGHGFLYLPQAALVFAPWAILPHTACELVWRWSIIGVLAASVVQLTRMLKGDGRWFFAISASSAVLAWGCARNGQSTTMITGLMILAAVDLSESRWWRAAILLSVAFAFKPLALVMILLAAVIYPQMSWRLAIGVCFVAVAPFLTQRPDYVIAQYQGFVQNLKVTFDIGDSENWAQLFSMLQVAGLPIPAPVRTILRAVAAVATLAICWKGSRHLSPQRTAFYLFSMAACYLMLFNSRTEGNTYTMVGPVYGALLAEALYRLRDKTTAGWMIAAVALSVANYELAILVTRREDAIWICPLVCVGVMGYLVLRIFQDIRNPLIDTQETPTTEPVPSSIPQRFAA